MIGQTERYRPLQNIIPSSLNIASNSISCFFHSRTHLPSTSTSYATFQMLFPSVLLITESLNSTLYKPSLQIHTSQSRLPVTKDVNIFICWRTGIIHIHYINFNATPPIFLPRWQEEASCVGTVNSFSRCIAFR